MDKTDTLVRTTQKSTLQEILARAAGTKPTATHPRRRAEDNLPESNRTDTESRVSTPAPLAGDLYGPSAVVLEPVSRKPYDLSYACLLIPRFSAHYLIGDIAESLREWMHQLCISYAWRLEEISIRPEYMQWVLYVPAATPPSRCIRNLREQTSRLIFEDFPHIRRENVSKDFWAPGYLVIMGPTPHPPEMIKEYIRLTRQQQGIQPHLSK